MALRCGAIFLWALLLPHPSAATPVRAVWSPAHNDTSCERTPTARLPPVPACSLAQCKQHCESAANCHFINHAPGNLACELYSSCDQPWCRQIAPGGGSTWWNAYQLTSPNATAFQPCAAPGPSPPPSPPLHPTIAAAWYPAAQGWTGKIKPFWFGANHTGLDSEATLALMSKHSVAGYGWQTGGAWQDGVCATVLPVPLDSYAANS